MNEWFAGWFLIDDPMYPVLLYVARRDAGECPLSVAGAVREIAVKIARKHGIDRSVHVGPYLAYVSILNACRKPGD